LKADTRVESFSAGLEAYHAYITSCLASLEKTKTVSFSSEHLQSLIMDISEPLRTHLGNEVVHLASFAQRFNNPDHILRFKAASEVAQKNAMKTATLTESVPLMMLNHDKEYENGLHGGFPPMPWVVSVVFRRGMTWARPGWWKFAACDAAQRVKALAY
jgi:hypothetical protein